MVGKFYSDYKRKLNASDLVLNSHPDVFKETPFSRWEYNQCCDEVTGCWLLAPTMDITLGH